MQHWLKNKLIPLVGVDAAVGILATGAACLLTMIWGSMDDSVLFMKLFATCWIVLGCAVCIDGATD